MASGGPVRSRLRRPIRKKTVTASDPRAASSRPIHMNRPLADAVLAPISVQWDADRALTVIYGGHYLSLVRLAVLLVHDVATAEDLVQDSFVAMHTAWPRLRDGDKALAYLRHSVVNRSRSVLRHPIAIERNAHQPRSGMTGAGHGALSPLPNAAVVGALASLPARQREAVVLRYYADLPEAQVASAMGVSEGA